MERLLSKTPKGIKAPHDFLKNPTVNRAEHQWAILDQRKLFVDQQKLVYRYCITITVHIILVHIT